MLMAGFLHNLRMMPMTSKSSFRLVRDYTQRKQSLIADGYIVRHETHLETSCVCRLYHPKRQRTIVLLAARGVLQQKTDGVIVHQQSYEDNQ